MKRKTLLKTKKTLKKKTQIKRAMEFSSACRMFYHNEHILGSILVSTLMELADMYSTILSEYLDTMRTMYTGNPDTTIQYIRIFLRDMATVLQNVETDRIAPGEEDIYYGFIGDVVTEVKEVVNKYKSELKTTKLPTITIPKIYTIVKSKKSLTPIEEDDDLLAEFSKLGI